MKTTLRLGASLLAFVGVLAAAAAANAQVCSSDAECDDGRFCNGVERCVRLPFLARRICLRGTASPCQAPYSVCDEPQDRCYSGQGCASDQECSDGAFCNGAEICGLLSRGGRRCTVGPVPCPAGEECVEASETCDRCGGIGDQDGDGWDSVDCGGTDCDDQDPSRHPGAVEVCDAAGHDEDCDPLTFGDRDRDDDGYIDALCCNGQVCGDDCDDQLASVHPTEAESCDGYDNDCDGLIDEGIGFPVYADLDRDGHGAGPTLGYSCRPALQTAWTNNDCDDLNAAIRPGAQVCTQDGAVQICGEDGTFGEPVFCPDWVGAQGACVPQPNGTGVCTVIYGWQPEPLPPYEEMP